VAYHYKHDYERLKALFPSAATLGRGISPEDSARIEKDWNLGKISILLANPKSVQFGLNLQEACTNVCWFSLTWDLQEYIQFNARVWRSGVRNRAIVHRLIMKNTTDEAMVLRLESRDNDQNAIRAAIRQYRKNTL